VKAEKKLAEASYPAEVECMNQQIWNTRILQDFVPGLARLTIVADPDGLLLAESMSRAIHQRGFEILVYDEPINFRYVYENLYRSQWDNGKLIELVLICWEDFDPSSLPYDVLRQSRRLDYTLKDIFPDLSYQVVAGLDRSYFDRLYQIQNNHPPAQKLGVQATLDYLLKYLYQFTSETIQQPAELLQVLLHKHYQGEKFPALLDNHLVQVLGQREVFREWPLDKIIPEQGAFFQFLQAHWSHFLENWLNQQKVKLDEDSSKRLAETKEIYQVHSTLDLPFDDQNVRIYIDNLFVEGFLKPVEFATLDLPTFQPGDPAWWVGLGLHSNQTARFEKLLQMAEQTLSPDSEKASYQQWLAFAHRWAELKVLKYNLNISHLNVLYQELENKVDQAFLSWVQAHYSNLRSLSGSVVMVHQIAKHALARLVNPVNQEKAALVVMDGMALEQWLILRDVLEKQISDLQISESAVFAWIPTLTSISRQSIFAGREPFYFADSLFTTNKESKLWEQFWLTKGFNQVQIGYKRSLGQEASLKSVAEMVEHPQLRIAGLVVDEVDQMMHGSRLGMAGLHNQVRQWAEQGFMAKLLNLLFDNGFKVFITSDHGNIEATGYGVPSEGRIAEVRGERVRIYNEESLRHQVKIKLPEAIEWQDKGIPADCLSLIAPGRMAFIWPEERCITHGGISLEEVIVPYVQVVRAKI
jgi:hypothetical protein